MQLQQPLNYSARVGSTVYIIAQSDKSIFGAQFDGIQQSVERCGAPMNIPDGKNSHFEFFLRSYGMEVLYAQKDKIGNIDLVHWLLSAKHGTAER